jgi:hypothetical protein
LRTASLASARACVRSAAATHGVVFEDSAAAVVVSAASAYDAVLEFM